MAFMDLFKSKKKDSNMQLAKLMNDQPIFSQFGDDIYASDVVQNCIDVIATECSKMQLVHIRTDTNGVQTRPKSSINRLFKVSPNPLMTTRDFLEKVIWILYLQYNCFIYPIYEIYDDGQGNKRKRFTAMYPLDPNQVTFLQDATGTMYVEFMFSNGHQFTVPYSKVIHLRKKFSNNDIMGGGMNGQPDNAPLLKILETNNTVIDGISTGIKTSLAVRGILKVNTTLNGDDQKKEQQRFEQLMAEGETGILPLDLKGEYIPITSDPKMIDKDTLEYLDQKVLRWYRVSAAILSGDFEDEEYQAFYETALEPLLITLGQAFTKTIFSDREIDMGNEIRVYQKDMMYLSMRSRLDIIKVMGEQGLLTDDQKLQIMGQPPIGGEDGARRTQSLNYANTNIVNDYQMAKANSPQINTGGE